MTTKRLERIPDTWPELKPAPPVVALQTSDAHAIAGAIVNNALDWVSARLDSSRDAAVRRLNRRDTAAQRELKLGLARYVAEYLGFFDEDVKAVYVADHSDTYQNKSDTAASRSIIHLVVFADPKTAALTLLVEALNRALTRVLSNSVEFTKTERFLDVQVVNSADLANLARYAALLTTPPSANHKRIWQRDT
jgi:hypothetical protein